MKMNKLERTLVELAEQHLAEVLRFLDKRYAGTASDEDQIDYLRDFGALYGLLELGHISDSGMTADASSAMLEVEARYAAAVRVADPTELSRTADVKLTSSPDALQLSLNREGCIVTFDEPPANGTIPNLSKPHEKR